MATAKKVNGEKVNVELYLSSKVAKLLYALMAALSSAGEHHLSIYDSLRPFFPSKPISEGVIKYSNIDKAVRDWVDAED